MAPLTTSRLPRALQQALLLSLLFVSGLALSRLLYEGLFPNALWLARPLPVTLLALLVSLAVWLPWRLARHSQPRIPVWVFTPLLLNLLYLPDPAVNVAGSRFIFAASIWLVSLLLARALAPARWWPWLGLLLLVLALLPAYLLTIPSVVGQADTFEFQVVAPALGIAHPTGYPLYLLLARLFAALPVGTMAWRVNLASAVFALLALSLLYLSGRRLLGRDVPAILAAVFLGLTPVMWSQAVVAEVYALHALVVAAVLWLLLGFLQDAPPDVAACDTTRWPRKVWLLAFLLGLGLTNHLTTLFLLPPSLLAVWFAYGRCLRADSWRANLRLVLLAGLCFLLPLLLYAYLPLRWQALNGEPMGLARFVDWVVGGRFQGALQLRGWLTDPGRYAIVGRLFLTNWGWFNLTLAAVGLAYLFRRGWRAALVLLVAWLGFVFYALNYYVPDLAVFLIPAHLITAVWWGAGLAGAMELVARLLRQAGHPSWTAALQALILVALLVPALNRSAGALSEANRPAQVALQAWGAGVLDLPLPEGAAILADSEKIAPLYYLQQAEGVRPDLEIVVLPDEAAYRAELDARLAARQAVYLARFLPGLEGVYHLRSLGPLLEVSTQPLSGVPADSTAAGLDFGPLRLLAYALQEPAAVDAEATAVTFYWQAQTPPQTPLRVYTRWRDPQSGVTSGQSAGQHPAGNYYPTVAWRGTEIVPDFHLLPRPVSSASQELALEVALGPAFAAAEELVWQTVTTVRVGRAAAPDLAQPLRAQNGRVLLRGAQFPAETRPGTPLPLRLDGYGPSENLLHFRLAPAGQDFSGALSSLSAAPPASPRLTYATTVDTDLPPGPYRLVSEDPAAGAICGWLARPSAACDLGQVTISGAPLPTGATNFDDKIALLEIAVKDKYLLPGGKLPVTLLWQGLAPLDEDYTVFLQVLDAQDRLVGQVDAWPQQGTFPTSQWAPGEQVRDPYEIQLAADLPPGDYRLQAGLYLLGTLQRLPVLDEVGRAVDDKVVVSGFTVSE